MAKFLIVEARFYDHLNDMLVAGAQAAIKAAGHSSDVLTVPGALEIPGAIALAARHYDGFVALGCVIRGETTHYDTVCNDSSRGLTLLGLQGVCIGNGILTVEDEDQAWARAKASEGDKGGGAARACLDLIALRKRLRGGLGA